MTSGPSATTSLLAVYGTLRRGYRNHPLIAQGSTLLGIGHLPGRLVHVATPLRRYPYPGYLPGAPATGRRVVVEVMDITDDTLWASLDALERYLPADPTGSEYLRVSATATLSDGRALTCWTYTYNAPAVAYADVPDGDWASLVAPDVTGL